MKTRTIASLLSLLLLLPVLASCGGQTPREQVTTPSADTTAPSEDTTIAENTYLPDDLPDDINYNDATIGIYVHPYLVNEIVDFAENDIVSAAVVKRNQFVEERLHVKIEPIYDENESSETYNGNMVNRIRSGDNSFDLVASSDYVMCMSQALGVFRNMYGNEIISWDKPWWRSGMNEAVRCRDDLILQLYGDYNYFNIAGLYAIYFNKQIITDVLTDISVDDLYQTALDGKWTVDKLAQYVRTIAHDLDGDQVMGENDRYGIAFGGHLQPWLSALGAVFSGREEDGTPYVDLSSEHNVDVTRVIADLHNNPAYSLRYDAVARDDLFGRFLSDKAGFLYAPLSTSYEYLRTMETEYGILPMPKYDEAQANYRCEFGSSSGWAVSSCVADSDMERMATFLEAMASASYRMVIPAYYEKALKTKYTHDSISSKIIDIIHDSSYVDFAGIYGDRVDNPVEKTCKIILEDPNTYASKVASLATSAQKTLNSYLKKMNKLK